MPNIYNNTHAKYILYHANQLKKSHTCCIFCFLHQKSGQNCPLDFLYKVVRANFRYLCYFAIKSAGLAFKKAVSACCIVSTSVEPQVSQAECIAS